MNEAMLRDGIPIQKGIVLTRQFLDRNQELFVKYLNFWILYPDAFLDIIQDFEDAKHFWENIAELEWDKVNSSEKSKMAYFKDKPDYEGHWYFSIDEILLSALNNEFAERIKENALFEKKEEIIKDAEDSLKLRLRREAREEYRKKILQLLQELE